MMHTFIHIPDFCGDNNNAFNHYAGTNGFYEIVKKCQKILIIY